MFRKSCRQASINATAKIRDSFTAWPEEIEEERPRKRPKRTHSTIEEENDAEYRNDDSDDGRRSIVPMLEKFSFDPSAGAPNWPSCSPCPACPPCLRRKPCPPERPCQPCPVCHPWHPIFQPDEDDEEIKPELDEHGEVRRTIEMYSGSSKRWIPAQQSPLQRSLSMQEFEAKMEMEMEKIRLRMAEMRLQRIQKAREEEKKAGEPEKAR